MIPSTVVMSRGDSGRYNRYWYIVRPGRSALGFSQTTAEPDHQSKSYEMAEFSRLLNFRCDNLGKESLFFLTFDDENQPGIHKVFHPTVVKYVYSSLFL